MGQESEVQDEQEDSLEKQTALKQHLIMRRTCLFHLKMTGQHFIRDYSNIKNVFI